MGVLNTSAAVSSRPLAVSSPCGISTFSCAEGSPFACCSLWECAPPNGLSPPNPIVPSVRSTTVGSSSSSSLRSSSSFVVLFSCCVSISTSSSLSAGTVLLPLLAMVNFTLLVMYLTGFIALRTNETVSALR